MTNKLLAGTVVALSVAIAPACATKGFVRTEVGGLEGRVDSLGETVDETIRRVGQSEEDVAVVDRRAESAGLAAGEAQAAADAAAAAARDVDARLGGRIDAADRAGRRLVFEVTLSENQGNFAFGNAALPEEAKGRLDELVATLQADPANVYFEIEGHTDNIGAAALNERLGFERAESVMRYLYERHQVPLHKMNVISYGEDKPLGPNESREGRAQNRRVVVRVLS
jgi:outer membrane protein OmpA-like peptidoglycan-associated protein